MFRTFTKQSTEGFNFLKLLKILIRITFAVMILLYILAFFPQLFRYKDLILETNFKVTVVLIILLIIAALHYIFFKSRSAKTIGIMTLKQNEIEINGKVLRISELQSIRIIGNDIKNDFRGFITKGIDNKMILKLNSGEEISSFFEQTSENNLKNLKNVLEVYKEKKLLSKANFDNILNNTNYY